MATTCTTRDTCCREAATAPAEAGRAYCGAAIIAEQVGPSDIDIRTYSVVRDAKCVRVVSLPGVVCASVGAFCL